MYGIVNNAISQHVIEQDGEAAWDKILASTDLENTEFAATMPYDDSTTITLVGAAAKAKGCDISTMLKEIGCYWVSYAGASAFANLLTMAGQGFEQVIANLDNMHAMIKVSLPKCKPPHFSAKRLDDDSLEIFYDSERPGLFPFVEGLFEGLARRFDQKVTILNFEQVSPSAGRWIIQLEASSSHAA